jgi:hypothetical protein
MRLRRAFDIPHQSRAQTLNRDVEQGANFG